MACPSGCNKSTNSRSLSQSSSSAQKPDAVSPFHFSLLAFHPLSRLSRAPFLRQSRNTYRIMAGCHVTTRRRSILDLNLCYLCYLLFKILFASFRKGGLGHCFATGRSQ